MTEVTTKLGVNGRLVIPANIRHKLHLSTGDELIMRVEHNELRLFSLKHSIKKAQAVVKRHTKGKSLVKALKNIRRADEEKERE
jgi:AbrB family looped-hinge helix DNA binding protein